VDDQVDVLGHPVPRLLAQTQVQVSDVAGEDLQVLAGQLLEMSDQFRVAAVEGCVESLARCSRVVSPDDAD
jgi:hypothetical protein